MEIIDSFSAKDHHPLRQCGRNVRPVSKGEIGYFSLTSVADRVDEAGAVGGDWEAAYHEDHRHLPVIHEDFKRIADANVRVMSGMHVNLDTPSSPGGTAVKPEDEARRIDGMASEKGKACLKWLANHAADPALTNLGG